MSLRLLIDEDSQSTKLIDALTQFDHDVLTINDVEMTGIADEQVLELGRTENRVVLTRNCQDFEDLHIDGVKHSGILAVYQNKDRTKNMGRKDICKAIANLEALGTDLKGQFVRLNAWQF